MPFWLRDQNDRRVSRQHPGVIIQGRNTSATIARILARPGNRPLHVQRGSEQRLRHRSATQVRAEVHQQEAIQRRFFTEKAQYEYLWPQYCTIDAVWALPAEGRIISSQPQEIPMQLHSPGVLVDLGQVQLAPLERR